LPGGKIRQDVLHSFDSPETLKAVLEPGQWTEWKSSMIWRNGNVRWEWKAIRTKLEEELLIWEEAPGGAALRRRARLQSSLVETLALLGSLASGRTADVTLIEGMRNELARLRNTVERLLGHSPGSQAIKEDSMRAEKKRARGESEELFDEGMEFWWSGDRNSACRCFRRVLKEDALHADSHNHLGIASFDRRRFRQAGEHFEKAIEGGARHLVKERGRVRWGWLENRPYLRGLYNLGLVRSEQGSLEEALAIQEDLLFLNPGDNQGVRWLVGHTLHRLGRLEEAIEAYRNALEEPGCCCGLALASFESGDEGKAGLALLRGIAANQYIVPMLLGEKWQLSDNRQHMSMAEPGWAADYLDRDGDLWRKAPGSAGFLSRWWNAAAVRQWLARMKEVESELSRLESGPERSLLLHKLRGLKDDVMLSEVASEVDPSVGRVSPLRRPVAAGIDEVSIKRDGGTAIIEYADPSVSTVHLQLGEGSIEHMSDEQILAMHNALIAESQEIRASYEHVAVEIGKGSPQVEYDPLVGSWLMVGQVLRCLIDEGEEPVRFLIDDRALSLEQFGRMLRTFAGWGMRLAIVPDDELDEEPVIRVRNERDLS